MGSPFAADWHKLCLANRRRHLSADVRWFGIEARRNARNPDAADGNDIARCRPLNDAESVIGAPSGHRDDRHEEGDDHLLMAGITTVPFNVKAEIFGKHLVQLDLHLLTADRCAAG